MRADPRHGLRRVMSPTRRPLVRVVADVQRDVRRLQARLLPDRPLPHRLVRPSYATAFTCLRDPRCGYCEDDGTCREVAIGAPLHGHVRAVALARGGAPAQRGGGDGGIEALARAVAQLSAGRSDRIAAAAAAANRTNATAAPPRACCR